MFMQSQITINTKIIRIRKKVEIRKYARSMPVRSIKGIYKFLIV